MPLFHRRRPKSPCHTCITTSTCPTRLHHHYSQCLEDSPPRSSPPRRSAPWRPRPSLQCSRSSRLPSCCISLLSPSTWLAEFFREHRLRTQPEDAIQTMRKPPYFRFRAETRGHRDRRR